MNFDSLDERVVPATFSLIGGAFAPAVQAAQFGAVPGVRDAIDMRNAFNAFGSGLDQFSSRFTDLLNQAVSLSGQRAGLLDDVFANSLNRMGNRFTTNLNRGIANPVDLTGLQNRFTTLTGLVQNNLGNQLTDIGNRFASQFNAFTTPFNNLGTPFADAGSQFGGLFNQSFTDLGGIVDSRFGTLDEQTSTFTRFGGLFNDAVTNFGTLGPADTISQFNTGFDSAFDDFGAAGLARTDRISENVITFSSSFDDSFRQGRDTFRTGFISTFGFDPTL